MINQAFHQEIIEGTHKDEMEIDRICDRRYNYMMATYYLGKLGGTLVSKGKPKYVRRGHFSKHNLVRTSSSSL